MALTAVALIASSACSTGNGTPEGCSTALYGQFLGMPEGDGVINSYREHIVSSSPEGKRGRDNTPESALSARLNGGGGPEGAPVTSLAFGREEKEHRKNHETVAFYEHANAMALESTGGNSVDGTEVVATGTNGDDKILGSHDADNLSGGGGNDRLYGFNGTDTLNGDNGNDLLYGGSFSAMDGEADTLLGGAGDDRLYVDGADLSLGLVDGGDGVDKLYVQDAGGVTLDLAATNVEMAYGSTGDDTLDASGATVNIYLSGGAGLDILTGGSGADELRGGDGDDILRGGGGMDEVRGEGGNDMLYGSAGADILTGGEGDDQVYIDELDTLYDGGIGTDTLYIETVFGLNINLAATDIERAYGNVGNDTLNASALTVDSLLDGGDGDDKLYGGSASDDATGGSGADDIYGYAGNDALKGDGGDDRLFGGADDDTLTGGSGDDELWGGSGNDTAMFTGLESEYIVTDLGGGKETVEDTVAGRDGTDTLWDIENIVFSITTPVPLGGDIMVTSLGNIPSIAALAYGGFVIAWEKNENGTLHIHAQRYHADGTTNGAEIIVAAGVPNGVPYQGPLLTEESVAALDDGGFVITWDRIENGTKNIYAQRYHADGTTNGAEIIVAAGNDPFITSLSDGGFVITWTTDVNGSGDVHAQLYHAAGTTNGAKIIVAAGNTFQRSDFVAALSGGGFVITWVTYENGLTNIHARRYNASGTALGSEIAVTASMTNQYDSSVSGLSDGGFVITWEGFNGGGSDSDVHAQRYHADGTTNGAEIIVSPVVGYQIRPSITALSDGGFVITWEAEDEELCYAQRYDASGNTVGNVFRLNEVPEDEEGEEPYATRPVVTELADGTLVFVWDGGSLFTRLFDTGITPTAIRTRL